ncbi:hypothetical protein BW39_05682 [Delftia sp. RIT313]|nr:hypothetical protein BW39_05682 [Delftia sp. RIT313]
MVGSREQLRRRPAPQLQQHQLMLRVQAAGVCLGAGRFAVHRQDACAHGVEAFLQRIGAQGHAQMAARRKGPLGLPAHAQRQRGRGGRRFGQFAMRHRHVRLGFAPRPAVPCAVIHHQHIGAEQLGVAVRQAMQHEGQFGSLIHAVPPAAIAACALRSGSCTCLASCLQVRRWPGCPCIHSGAGVKGFRKGSPATEIRMIGTAPAAGCPVAQENPNRLSQNQSSPIRFMPDPLPSSVDRSGRWMNHGSAGQ